MSIENKIGPDKVDRSDILAAIDKVLDRHYHLQSNALRASNEWWQHQDAITELIELRNDVEAMK